MKQFFLIILCSVFFLVSKAGMIGDMELTQTQVPQTDTAIKLDPVEEKIIEEIVTTKLPPTKEKVQYFSQVTKYGFKNLFSRYNYNPTLPYSSQVNPNAESYMQDYLRSHSSSLIKMKSWGQPYFTLMDNILSQYGLPRELKYLAVIESNLSTSATSWVGAGGPWQFMPYTAREYGLVVNGFIDERRDYYKSTHAAARYLLTLYKQTKDWLLVIAAYNGGPGRVFSAIKRSGSRNFWQLQYQLPTESRNHVKKFIATHYIMEGTGGITTASTGGLINVGNNFDAKLQITEEEALSTSTQTISGKFNSLVISKNLGMDINHFNRYNPGFDNLIMTNGNFDLRLPQDKMDLFMATKYQILNECVQLLLADNSIPNQQTNYPPAKTGKTNKKKRG